MGIRNCKRNSQNRDQTKVRVEQAKVHVVPVEEEHNVLVCHFDI